MFDASLVAVVQKSGGDLWDDLTPIELYALMSRAQTVIGPRCWIELVLPTLETTLLDGEMCCFCHAKLAESTRTRGARIRQHIAGKGCGFVVERGPLPTDPSLAFLHAALKREWKATGKRALAETEDDSLPRKKAKTASSE